MHAQLQGNGALAARLIAEQLYPGVRPEELTESQKQTVSVLGTLAAGLAGGLAGDSTADAVAGAQAGKNAAENNFLGANSPSDLITPLKKSKRAINPLSLPMNYLSWKMRINVVMRWSLSL